MLEPTITASELPKKLQQVPIPEVVSTLVPVSLIKKKKPNKLIPPLGIEGRSFWLAGVRINYYTIAARAYRGSLEKTA